MQAVLSLSNMEDFGSQKNTSSPVLQYYMFKERENGEPRDWMRLHIIFAMWNKMLDMAQAYRTREATFISDSWQTPSQKSMMSMDSGQKQHCFFSSVSFIVW